MPRQVLSAFLAGCLKLIRMCEYPPSPYARRNIHENAEADSLGAKYIRMILP